MEEAERELDQLEGKSENFSGTTDEETEMLETLKAQHEAVEAERKVKLMLFSSELTKVIKLLIFLLRVMNKEETNDFCELAKKATGFFFRTGENILGQKAVLYIKVFASNGFLLAY